MNGKNQESSNWLTPRVLEVDESYENYQQRMVNSKNPKNIGKKRPSNLTMQVKLQDNWPTPRASNPGSRPNGKGGKILAEEVRKMAEKRSGKLNPDWCEQLMGLPVGWTKIDDADDRISRLMAIGNGVVPQTAALAWETLSEKIKQ